jgi:DNA-cytosine methyltransferase
MNIVSTFDGMSCGYVACKRSGKKITNYFASEIDKYAIKVSRKNFPQVQQMGDVTKLHYIDRKFYIDGNEVLCGVKHLVDLLIGGSPCQGFSFAGDGLAFNDPRSRLFFEFVRLKNELQAGNPNLKFLLENVPMKKKHEDVITKILGVQPIKINAALVSGQNRERLFWTNIEGITQPEDKGICLKDILESNVSEKYYHSEAAIEYMNRIVKGGRNHWDFCHHSDTNKMKSAAVVANFLKGVPYNVLIDRVNQINPYHSSDTMKQPKLQHRIFHTEGKSPSMTASHSGRTSIYPDKGDLIRKLTPIECERLQGLPDNYTAGVSDTQRYKMIGNGWNVDVITHILSFL